MHQPWSCEFLFLRGDKGTHTQNIWRKRGIWKDAEKTDAASKRDDIVSANQNVSSNEQFVSGNASDWQDRVNCQEDKTVLYFLNWRIVNTLWYFEVVMMLNRKDSALQAPSVSQQGGWTTQRLKSMWNRSEIDVSFSYDVSFEWRNFNRRTIRKNWGENMVARRHSLHNNVLLLYFMFVVFQVFQTNPAPRRLPIWPQALTSQARGTQLMMTQSVMLEDASVGSARTLRHNSCRNWRRCSLGIATLI